MSQYRVTFNGRDYRVEHLRKPLLLRWRSPRWRPVDFSHPEGFSIRNFYSERDARQAMNICIAQEKADRHGYAPIDEDSV
jgi:hypothetical protein